MYRLFIDKNISSEELLKKILKKYHIAYDIFYNEHGKPYLKNNELFFNISHSKEYIVCAISDQEIGVDIEEITYKPKVVDRICTPEEKSKISNADDFTRIWVQKEAFVKKVGVGITYGLQNVDTILSDNIDVYKFKDYYIAVCY